jgi:outer membrane protein assembly factor BamD (BamD/ComL family)
MARKVVASLTSFGGILPVLSLGVLIWASGVAGPAHAVEEPERFLQALKERGYFDLAVDYLEGLRSSPLCPDSFRDVLDYHLGLTLIDLARAGGARSEQNLEQARSALERFLREKPSRPEVGNAAFQLANVLVEIGKLKRQQAEQPGLSAADREKLLAEARQRYQEAQEGFSAAERRAYERARILEEEAKKDPKKESERDEARRDLLRSRLFLAGVIYELGRTYPPDSEQYKKFLTEAAKRFSELFDRYSNFTAGLYARLQEGRIQRELGNTKAALEILKNLQGRLAGAEGEERPLANEVVAELIETYLAAKDYKTALATAEAWSKEARGDENTREGLMIAYGAGRAALELARQQKPTTAEQRQSLAAARRYLTQVARVPNPVRREAQKLLADPLLGQVPADSDKPATYQEAKEKGDDVWASLMVALARLAQASPEEQKKLQAEIDRFRDQALELYSLALRLREEEVSIQEVNLLRFRLCYLYWLKQDYFRAAVLGEFLARNYQQSSLARQAAEIAVKAYRVMFVQSSAPREERTFEANKIRELAEWMASIWPNEKETDEARMMLLDTAIDTRQMDLAREVVGQIPEDSPRRAEAELRLGQALWMAYLREAQSPPEDRQDWEKVQSWVAEAQKFLTQGVERRKAALEKGAAVDYTFVLGVRELARLYLETGQSAEAVRLLEDERYGPLTLVRKNNPATGRGSFPVDTLTLALRTYVAVQDLQKAEAVMLELEKTVGAAGDKDVAGRLTQIYVSLARQLQESLRRLRQENRQAEADQLTQGFELFLDRIREREAGNTFTSLNWVAETFMNMASSLEGGSPEERQKAASYYKKAAAVYVDILKRIQGDKTGQFAPAGAALSIQLRLAAALRGMGQHEKAVQILLGLLRQNEARVNVQVELARTYQEWGDAADKPEYYTMAITGGHQQQGRNLFWGWMGIARRVAPYPKFENVFHEAWYNIMLCRMKQAMKESEPRRGELLRQAETDAFRVYQLYPQMGGDEMLAKYDALLRRIQKLRGIANPEGIAAFAKMAGSRSGRPGTR